MVKCMVKYRVRVEFSKLYRVTCVYRRFCIGEGLVLDLCVMNVIVSVGIILLHTCTNTQVHINTYKQTRTYNTRTNTHVHTYTYKHTHKQNNVLTFKRKHNKNKQNIYNKRQFVI